MVPAILAGRQARVLFQSAVYGLDSEAIRKAPLSLWERVGVRGSW